MLADLVRHIRLPKSVHAVACTVVELLPSSAKHAKQERAIEAHCNRCARVTSQKAVWVGRIMKGRQCCECGLVTKPDPPLLGRCYVEEVMSRAAAKPEDLRQSPEESWRRRLLWAPVRVVTKSLEESRYVGELILDEREWVDSPHENAPSPASGDR